MPSPKSRTWRAVQARSLPAQGISAASVGWSAGGPLFQDDFRSKRAPNPTELVNQYKAVAYTCIGLNAKGVARVPLRLYAATRAGQRPPGRGLREISRPATRQQDRYLRSLGHVQQVVQGGAQIDEITDHQFLDAIARPCPYFDGSLLINYLATCLDVVGSAYLYPVSAGPGFVAREIWPLMAQYVFPVKGESTNLIDHYTFMGERIGPDELIRIRNISLRDPYLSGYSPLQAMFEQQALGNYYTSTVENLLRNGARPSGMITPEDSMLPGGQDEARRIEFQANGMVGGSRAGRVIVTQGAYKFTPFDFKPTDMGGLELTKFQRLLIANGFDVPISLIDAENSNRAVAEAGNYQHQRNAIAPRCVMIAASLTHYVQQIDPRLFVCFDDPVEEDQERKSKIFDMAVKNGTRTINEIRRENGDDEVDGGDDPILAGTYTTLARVIDGPPALMPAGPSEAVDEEKPEGKGRGLRRAERMVLRETLSLIRDLRLRSQ